MRGALVHMIAIAMLPLQALAGQDEAYTPEKALAAFQHDPMVRVELVASEPLVMDPVALCFDARGKLFVVENRGYPTDTDPPRGDVVLLEDNDDDGRMDTRTVFAEGFDFPNGIMAWKDGVLLTCAPDVLYLKDTDGDGRADVREVVLTGFAPGGSTQLRTSHPTLNLDGWIYFTNGLSGGEVRLPGAPESQAVKMGALDLRWDPWSGRIETTAGQAQFGQAFDDLGNKFVCSNRKHIEQVMLQPADLARAAFLHQAALVAEISDHEEAAKLFPISSNITTAYSHTGTFTAACGLVLYRGNALGPGFYRNAFVCDPTGNLVHRDVLGATGAAFTAQRAYPDREFLASPDNWFRPVFLANGPDGALYLCDMYRKTIEHPAYLPPEIAAKTDFASGRDMGRIYRIVAKDAPQYSRRAAMYAADTDVLLHALGDDNGWRRDTAFRLLLEARPANLAQRARILLKDSSPWRRLYALRLLAALNACAIRDVANALRDTEDPRVIATALHLNTTAAVPAATLKPLLQYPVASIRFRAALAAAPYPGYGDLSTVPYDGPVIEGLDKELAATAIEHAKDPWIVTAAFSSAANCISDFLDALLAAFPTQPARDTEAMVALSEKTGRMAGQLKRTEAFMGRVLSREAAPLEPWRLAMIAGCLDALPTQARQADAPAPFTALFGDDIDAARLEACRREIVGLSGDLAAEASARILAIRLIGSMDFAKAQAALAPYLAPQTPPAIQRAAIRALANTGAPEVGPLLAAPDTWTAYSGDARAAAKAAVFSREAWVLSFLESIEAGKISPYTLDPAARGQLMKSSSPEISAAATRVFAGIAGADRDKVLSEYQDALQLPGNRDAGHAVYTSTCAQCHVFQGEGHKVGPDLSDIRAQTPEYILMHVIAPNKAVTAGFESYTVSTKSLETYTGILAAENDAAITLRQALGVEQTIPRAEIDTLSTENRSLMPEELEKSVSKQQLRDLIAFLKGE